MDGVSEERERLFLNTILDKLVNINSCLNMKILNLRTNKQKTITLREGERKDGNYYYYYIIDYITMMI